MRGLGAEHRHHVYSRGQNPTVEALENKLARLERGEACKCFASGMGAVSATLFGLLEAGAHVLFVNQIYGPTLQLAERLAAYGVEHDVVLDPSLEAIAAAIRPNTRLVWMESPGTMTFRSIDIGGIASWLTHDALPWPSTTAGRRLSSRSRSSSGVDLVIHTAASTSAGTAT